jgi:thioredoxin-like negative regulator of GroEL
MRKLFLYLLFAVVVTAAVDARAVTLKNYPKEIAKPGITVVDYWAPWCGNCVAFKPEYNRAKRALGKSVHFLELNVDKVDDVESSFGLKYGLPTLALFKNGQLVSKLPGGGTAQEVIDWINANR